MRLLRVDEEGVPTLVQRSRYNSYWQYVELELFNGNIIHLPVDAVNYELPNYPRWNADKICLVAEEIVERDFKLGIYQVS